MKEKNEPVFLGVKSKGIMHPPNEIPNDFKEKVRNAVIVVLFNKDFRAG